MYGAEGSEIMLTGCYDVNYSNLKTRNKENKVKTVQTRISYSLKRLVSEAEAACRLRPHRC